MKKIILIVVLFICGKSVAQDYYHGIGVQLNTGVFNYSYQSPLEDNTFTGILGVPGIVYKASLSFEISRNSNFAISAYPFAGLMFSNVYGGYFGAELPILAEFIKGSLDDRCFFIGAGFSMSYLKTNGDGGSVVGPQVNVGGQFEFKERLIGIRGSWTYGINKPGRYIPSSATTYSDSKMMIGMSLFYPLGL